MIFTPGVPGPGQTKCDHVAVVFPTGLRSELTVRAVFDDRRALPFGGGNFVISTADWTERIGEPTDVTVL
ncbi:MAG: hypothetical protein V4532_14565, partial [Pseudomonadota bacterium]